MSNIWFTSDLHLGHHVVAQHRGFETTHGHDVAIQTNWLRVVKPDDQVWILGDLAVSQPGYALDCLKSWPGVKHLIAGNHDAVHPMHRQAARHQRAYLEIFDSVQAFARRRINGHDVLLSHFPYTADRGEIRYPQYRLPDLGDWLLHGHTHGTERRHGREIHIGLDAWNLAPVDINTVTALIDEYESRPTLHEMLNAAFS